jgi:uncharacterized protein (UPF0332 family)
MGSKEDAVREFTSRLRRVLGDKIAGIHLYGSLAKGVAGVESDIDLLIVYKGIERSKLLDVMSEIAFDIVCEHGELIETVPMSEEEFKQQVGRSPFLWEVLEHGRVIFAREEATEWKLEFGGYVRLAEEYLHYAEGALGENKVRLAIDAGYNATELLIKALILSTRSSLASSHGGIVGQFGELFVKSGKVDREIGRGVHKALTLRAQARYVPAAELSRADGEFVISLAKKILGLTKKELK